MLKNFYCSFCSTVRSLNLMNTLETTLDLSFLVYWICKTTSINYVLFEVAAFIQAELGKSRMVTYSRIGLLRSYGNLQSYWTTTRLWKLTVVLNYHEAMVTYSRIGLLRSYGNLQSYWTTTKLWKLTVVLDYYEAMETYSRI